MKRIKQIGCAVLAMVSLALLAACGPDVSTPSGAYQAGMDAMKNFDEKGLAAYFQDGVTDNMFDYFATFDETERKTARELAKAMYKKLETKVLEETVNGNSATLKVEIAWVDREEIQTGLAGGLAENGLTTADLSEKSNQDKLVQILKDVFGKAERTEPKTVTVPMILEDGQWRIAENPVESFLRQ